MDAAVADRLLGVIEGRCLTGQNGADWQVAAVRRFENRGMTRVAALREMVALYTENMHSNEPVHTWKLPD